MRITVSSLARSKLVGEQVVSITWPYVSLDLILPDQPNRAVRTRMLRGVGGAPCEGRPYPDIINSWKYLLWEWPKSSNTK
jgi:hypothetical protein